MQKKFLLCVFNLVFLSPLWGNVLWSPPKLFFNKSDHKRDFSLSINLNGDAVVGWFNEDEDQIEIAEYDFKSDTIHRPKIHYPCSLSTTLLKVILDENKDAFALWMDRVEGCLKASKYIAKEHVWTETLSLLDAESIEDPVLKIDSDGNALIVWKRFTGLEHQIQAVYFSSHKNQWSSLTTLSSVGYDCDCQKFAFDSCGNAIAVWNASLFFDSNNSKGIQSIRFDAETQQWEQSLFFSDYMGEFAPVSLDVIFDWNDHLVILWNSQNPTTHTYLFQFVSYNTAENRWGNKTLIEAKEEVFNPQLVNDHQHICAFWEAFDGEKHHLQSLSLNYPESSLPEKIEIPCNLSRFTDYKIKADHFGKIKIICADDKQIQISQLAGDWENNVLFDDQPRIKNLQIEGDKLGNALVIWEKNKQLFYSRGDYLLPPSNFSVAIVEKRFTAKTSLRALLSWISPKNPSISRYKIWRNDEVIADIPVNQTQFVDKNYQRGQMIYTICSVNDENLESQLSEFIIRN